MATNLPREIQQRQNLTAQLAAYLETRPYQIVTHAELVAQVGPNFRSRIANCREDLGMVIENVPVFRADGVRGLGSYVYRPQAIGRDAADLHAAVPTRLPLLDGPEGAWQR